MTFVRGRHQTQQLLAAEEGRRWSENLTGAVFVTTIAFVTLREPFLSRPLPS
ncbi:MAG: hypothetical protein ACI8UO_006514 [Verrucomicrobiales bacterium]|jgi:hypothetical protein